VRPSRIYEASSFYKLKVFGNLKTDNIMANVSLIFHGKDGSGTEKNQLECFFNINGGITISIQDEKEYYPTAISLDIPTAIKFAKVLRYEINEAKLEVDND
jgi:hypothetical protein